MAAPEDIPELDARVTDAIGELWTAFAAAGLPLASLAMVLDNGEALAFDASCFEKERIQ